MACDDLLAAVTHHSRIITTKQCAVFLSIDECDAERELCGLAGRCGGTFTLDSSNMATFSFPPNFERTSLSAYEKAKRLEYIQNGVFWFVGLLRFLFSLFLLLSLAMLSIAAVVAMFVSARSRSHNNNLVRQLRSNLHSVNNLSFLYILLGGNNPFMNSISSASLCCSATLNPTLLLNPWFLMRTMSMRRRRRVWALPTFDAMSVTTATTATTTTTTTTTSTAADNLPSKILAVVDNFLFGPPLSATQPTREQRVLLRIAVIQRHNGRLHPNKLSKWTDDGSGSATECLRLCYFFKGSPADDDSGEFTFPGIIDVGHNSSGESETKPQFSFFFADDEDGNYSPLETGQRDYLHEYPHVLTSLSRSEFLWCVALGVGNFIGVHLLATSPYTIISLPAVVSILQVYSWAFFCLPILRAGILALLNLRRMHRNASRSALSG